MTGRRRLAVVAGLLVAAALAAVLVWMLVLRRPPEPVSVEEVVAGRGEGQVYVYRTRGFEQVDVLLGDRHEYPAETTITVAAVGACSRLRWQALEGRATTWEVCPAADGLELRAYDETHRFLGQTERTVYRCDPGSSWLPSEREPGSAVARRCSTGETDESSSGEVVGVEPLDVGGTALDTVHVALAVSLGGRTRGSGSFEAWLRPSDGLPVRLELTNDNRSASPIGDVGYVEEASLVLSSLEPRS